VKPLQSVAMGLVVIALSARSRGYDLLPDPIGWLLVLQGLGRLPDTLPHRPGLRTLGFVALVMSVVLWFPGLANGLEDADESLLWAANLPQLAFVAVLCRALAEPADRAAARWLRTAATLTVVAAVLPVLVLGAGQSSLVPVMVVGSAAVLVLVIVLLFRYAGRRWAAERMDQTTAG
jgi:peptidoglycan/LPS O-acetylase OafA/YrhL